MIRFIIAILVCVSALSGCAKPSPQGIFQQVVGIPPPHSVTILNADVVTKWGLVSKWAEFTISKDALGTILKVGPYEAGSVGGHFANLHPPTWWRIDQVGTNWGQFDALATNWVQYGYRIEDKHASSPPYRHLVIEKSPKTSATIRVFAVYACYD
jgi:hypothetical protein